MNSSRSKMRSGYTTGTCAAAAAKAAAFMLLSGQETDRVSLQWQPGKGRSAEVEFVVEDPLIGKESASCAVRKDAGDDIDVTNGLLIYAKVSRLPDETEPDISETAESGNIMVIENEAISDEIADSEAVEQTKAISAGEIPDGVKSLFMEGTGKAGMKDAAESPGSAASGAESPEVRGILTSPEEEVLLQPVTLSDLENDQGIIPMRWDRAADYFKSVPRVQTVPDEVSPDPENEESHGGRFISVTEDGILSELKWSLIQELFQASGESQSQTLPDLTKNPVLSEQERFPIQGGEGIGLVTRPGLDQPPGEPAINSGPRRMIRDAVASVCESFEYEGRLMIGISVPGGEQIASRTFNPRLGIEGGISILGTTGIVEPMSGRAVAETVRAEVRVKSAAFQSLVFVPGNTGAAFVRRELLIPEEKTVIVSNYPGDALDEAVDSGVKCVLITGSIGKMIKLAGGIFHTHSRDADARLDILMRCAVQSGASVSVLRELDRCVTTEAGLDILEQNGLLERTIEIILNRAVACTRQRAEDLQVEMILLRNSGDVLAFTDEAFSVMMEEADA